MRLRPFAADDLPCVAPWFEDSETRRWLGGPDWPAQTLRLVGPDRFAFLALHDGAIVGLLDVERYSDMTASFAIAVDPALRRQGIGAAVLDLMLVLPELAGVAEVFAGVETGNDASRALLLRAGYASDGAVDEDGFAYYRHQLPLCDGNEGTETGASLEQHPIYSNPAPCPLASSAIE